MAEYFHKQMLKVGVHNSPRGPVVVTPERIAHWDRQTKRLQSKGYKVPSQFDHGSQADEFIPLPAKELARRLSAGKTVGNLHSFTPSPDGQSAEIVLSLSNGDAIEAAKTNRLEVSPVLLPKWTDADRETYDDFPSHWDLVNYAVDRTQTPFKPVALSLSPEAELLNPICFSLGAPMADDDEDKKGDEKPGESTDDKVAEKAEEKPITGDEPLVPVVEKPAEEEKPVDPLMVSTARVVGLLRGMGMPIEDSGTIQEFMSNLEKVLAAKVKPPEEETSTATPSAPQVQQPGPQMMSLQKQVVDMHREKLGARLKGCLDSGRMTPAQFEKLNTDLTVVRMSIDDAGQIPPGDVEKLIAYHETFAENSLAPKYDGKSILMSGHTVVEPSSDMVDGEETPEQSAAAARAQLERAGRIPRAQSYTIDNTDPNNWRKPLTS